MRVLKGPEKSQALTEVGLSLIRLKRLDIIPSVVQEIFSTGQRVKENLRLIEKEIYKEGLDCLLQTAARTGGSEEKIEVVAGIALEEADRGRREKAQPILDYLRQEVGNLEGMISQEIHAKLDEVDESIMNDGIETLGIGESHNEEIKECYRINRLLKQIAQNAHLPIPDTCRILEGVNETTLPKFYQDLIDNIKKLATQATEAKKFDVVLRLGELLKTQNTRTKLLGIQGIAIHLVQANVDHKEDYILMLLTDLEIPPILNRIVSAYPKSEQIERGLELARRSLNDEGLELFLRDWIFELLHDDQFIMIVELLNKLDSFDDHLKLQLIDYLVREIQHPTVFQQTLKDDLKHRRSQDDNFRSLEEGLNAIIQLMYGNQKDDERNKIKSAKELRDLIEMKINDDPVIKKSLRSNPLVSQFFYTFIAYKFIDFHNYEQAEDIIASYISDERYLSSLKLIIPLEQCQEGLPNEEGCTIL